MSAHTADQDHRNTDLVAAREEIAHLRMALMTRGVIDQAKGILMAQTGCTPSEAFDMLRAASMRDNRRLHEVAVRIVAGVVAQGEGRSSGGRARR